MTVKFIKSRQGYAYFAGDITDLADETASQLIEEGFVIPATAKEEDSNLPVDLPCRTLLIKNGLTQCDQVLASREVLTEIKGIGTKSAEEIINILEKI